MFPSHTQEATLNPLKLPELQHPNPIVLLHDQERRFTNLVQRDYYYSTSQWYIFQVLLTIFKLKVK